MDIRAIASPALAPVGGVAPTASQGTASFGSLLNDAITSLQKSQTEADMLASGLAAGEEIELHEVMLAMEQANLATQLAMQVRNKVVEAYQEISRMQV